MTAGPVHPAIERACAASAAQHKRLCPRQVLGVRMGIAAGRALDLSLPREDKRLLLFAETDGCVLDGITAATGCTPGHRTMRVVDYGRVAVTGIDLETRRAVRVAPRAGIRELATAYATDGASRYDAQLVSYQQVPEPLLLTITPVRLTLDVDALLGRPGVRVDCARCGEEVLNGREVEVDGDLVCPGCSGAAYYDPCGPLGVSEIGASRTLGASEGWSRWLTR